jgi:hypothetical protein
MCLAILYDAEKFDGPFTWHSIGLTATFTQHPSFARETIQNPVGNGMESLCECKAEMKRLSVQLNPSFSVSGTARGMHPAREVSPAGESRHRRRAEAIVCHGRFPLQLFDRQAITQPGAVRAGTRRGAICNHSGLETVRDVTLDTTTCNRPSQTVFAASLSTLCETDSRLPFRLERRQPQRTRVHSAPSAMVATFAGTNLLPHY